MKNNHFEQLSLLLSSILNIRQAQEHVPIISATKEAETEELQVQGQQLSNTLSQYKTKRAEKVAL